MAPDLKHEAAKPNLSASLGTPEHQTVNVAEANVEIRNRLGLHLRAATTLAQTAARFKSTVTLGRGKNQVNARSVTALIMLGAGKGTKLQLKAEGEDAQAAIAELTEPLRAMASARSRSLLPCLR